MKWLALAALAISVAAASPAHAQSEYHPLANYAEDDILEGAGWYAEPVAGFDAYPALSTGWTRTLIYRLPDPTILDPNGRPAPRFLLKRRAGSYSIDGDESRIRPEYVTWADSRACNRMFFVLDRMTDLRAPRVDVGLAPWIPPGIDPPFGRLTTRDEGERLPSGEGLPVDEADIVERVPLGRSLPMDIPLDGTTIRVWSRQGADSWKASGSVSMASSGGPIAEWAKFAEAWLEGCWQDEQPTLDSDAP